MDALPLVGAFIEEICAAAGLERQDALRVTLVVEELFTNTVRHGHGGDSDAPVVLALEIGAGCVALTYEDTGQPHDPFAAVTPPDESLDPQERPVGGLGLVLITRLATNIEYSYAGGRNRLALVVTTAPPPPG